MVSAARHSGEDQHNIPSRDTGDQLHGNCCVLSKIFPHKAAGEEGLHSQIHAVKCSSWEPYLRCHGVEEPRHFSPAASQLAGPTRH